MSDNVAELSRDDLADEGWVESVYQECARMSVGLDDDPLLYGPTRINQKIASCRRHLERTEVLFNEVSRRILLGKRLHHRLDTQFQLEEAGLMSDDPEVRAQRSIADRKALVTVKLHELFESRSDMASVIRELEAVLVVVKSKRVDLRNIQTHLREQVKMCQEAIGLGARWGSKVPPGRSVNMQPKAARPVAKDPTDLAHLIEKSTNEEHDLEPEEDPALAGQPSMDDLLRQEVLAAGGDLEGLDEWDTQEGGDEEPEPESAPQIEAPVDPLDAILAPDPTSPDPLTEELVAEAAGLPKKPEPKREPDNGDITQYEQIGFCSVCGEPQYQTPSGETCGEHGGAPTVDDPSESDAAKAKAEAEKPQSEDLGDLVLDDITSAKIEQKVEEAEVDIAEAKPEPDDGIDLAGLVESATLPQDSEPKKAEENAKASRGQPEMPPPPEKALDLDALEQKPLDAVTKAMGSNADSDDIDAFLSADPVVEEPKVAAQDLNLDDFLASL